MSQAGQFLAFARRQPILVGGLAVGAFGIYRLAGGQFGASAPVTDTAPPADALSPVAVSPSNSDPFGVGGDVLGGYNGIGGTGLNTADVAAMIAAAIPPPRPVRRMVVTESAPAVAPAPAAAPASNIVAYCSVVELRAGPGLQYPVLRTLAPGTPCHTTIGVVAGGTYPASSADAPKYCRGGGSSWMVVDYIAGVHTQAPGGVYSAATLFQWTR